MRHCLIACLVVLPIVSHGAESPTTASTQLHEQMLAYQLTLPKANALIAALKSMTQYVASLPDFADRMKKAMKMTAGERLAQMEADPKAMAILSENGLTAEEYAVGVPTLRNALLAAQNMPGATASPANVAFAKAHLTDLRPQMDAADGMTHAK
jgi:hypothetical protein